MFGNNRGCRNCQVVASHTGKTRKLQNALREILESLQLEQLSIDKVSEEIKTLWLAHKLKSVKGDNRKIVDIINDTINKTIIVEFNDINVQLSGNVDHKKIREIGENYGFAAPNPSVSVGYLLTIKDKRNKLAHGEITFADCGKGYTVQELKKHKNDTITYLQEFVQNVASYLENKSYLQSIPHN